MRLYGSSTLTLIYYNAVSSSVEGAERATTEAYIRTAVVAIVAVLRGGNIDIEITFRSSLRTIS